MIDRHVEHALDDFERASVTCDLGADSLIPGVNRLGSLQRARESGMFFPQQGDDFLQGFQSHGRG